MIKIIHKKISQSEIEKFLGNPFRDMIKFVVDVKREIIALGGELHSDAEALLLEDGSKQSDVWGCNFYPHKPKELQIDYTALINIRPSANNLSMSIKDQKTKAKIKKIVEKLLQ